ncbi:hypothetical protein AAHA92_31269 [Salvia divinorum]|uniref:Uncharacterized protein n=1 Tax=Salvia divinorum TaxID=28513 RepID=A0ABD1FTM9_SALDI
MILIHWVKNSSSRFLATCLYSKFVKILAGGAGEDIYCCRADLLPLGRHRAPPPKVVVERGGLTGQVADGPCLDGGPGLTWLIGLVKDWARKMRPKSHNALLIHVL